MTADGPTWSVAFGYPKSDLPIRSFWNLLTALIIFHRPGGNLVAGSASNAVWEHVYNVINLTVTRLFMSLVAYLQVNTLICDNLEVRFPVKKV